jgi:hypothetical protein
VLISWGLLAGLAWTLYGLPWRTPASLLAVMCVLLFAVPLALSALWAVMNLAHRVTASVVVTEIRVVDRTLSIRLPATWRAVEFEWERGEVADLRLTRPSGRPWSRNRLVLNVSSDDGHRATLALPELASEDARRGMERVHRAALGLGPDVEWDEPPSGWVGALA